MRIEQRFDHTDGRGDPPAAWKEIRFPQDWVNQALESFAGGDPGVVLRMSYKDGSAIEWRIKKPEPTLADAQEALDDIAAFLNAFLNRSAGEVIAQSIQEIRRNHGV